MDNVGLDYTPELMDHLKAAEVIEEHGGVWKLTVVFRTNVFQHVRSGMVVSDAVEKAMVDFGVNRHIAKPLILSMLYKHQ